MIKKLILGISLILCLFITACTSTSGEGEINTSKIKWVPVNSIDQLKGQWKNDETQIIFPKSFDGKEYLLMTEPKTDDSELWSNYSVKKGVPVRELWQKKYAACNEIYKKNYPLSDSNGCQQGIKFSEPIFMNKYLMKVQSHVETLVPEDIIFKNLSFFSVSQDGKYLKESGTFRFYSVKIQNMYVEERIFTLVEE